MATIEDWATDYACQTINGWVRGDKEKLRRYNSYIEIAKSQQKKDIEKACEWIMRTPMYAKQPCQLV